MAPPIAAAPTIRWARADPISIPTNIPTPKPSSAAPGIKFLRHIKTTLHILCRAASIIA